MTRFYELVVWDKARRIQLATEPLCRLCAASGRTMPANDVDHIVRISLGGAELDPYNLRSLCRPCHSRVTWRQLNKSDKPMKGCDANGQLNILEGIYGPVHDDGRRVVRTALITMPRKQGKTELAATLALYHLLGDDEKGGQVYSAATDRYQVALVFNAFEPFLETKNKAVQN